MMTDCTDDDVASALGWTMRRRVEAVLRGRPVDRPPFIDRLELWYAHHCRTAGLPEAYTGMSLNQIHSAVGMGQQRFRVPYAFRLRGVELICTFDGQLIRRESDPVTDHFPTLAEMVVTDRAGVSTMELLTPAGGLRVQHEILRDMVEDGTGPYMKEHPVKDEQDLRAVEYIMERAEYLPQYEALYREEEAVGDIGYVVNEIQRIPFQQVLLEYLGEMQTFYALRDNPRLVERLLALADQQMMLVLGELAALDRTYVEFSDNLHGLMTNPKLFTKYCLPHYQRYADILHGQGKVMGSHTDGDVRSLLGLLAESGLDVCESFSPLPLTSCSFEEAWQAWRDGPIIWGGVPSPVLEARTSEAEFRGYVRRLLDLIDGRPIILGVGDLVMGNNLIERVQYIAEQLAMC